MDTYLHSFLFEHRGLDEETQRQINHFRYQYLLKVANIVYGEAVLFQRDLSPFGSLNRGNYHRCYQSANILLSAIEEEVGRQSGRKAGELILLNQRELTSLLSRIGRAEKEEVLPLVARGGFTPSLQDAASMAASLNLYAENEVFAFPEQKSGVDTIEELLRTPQFTSFKTQTFTAAAIAELLQGFQALPIASTFERKGCASLLCDSYGRILHYIEEALQIPLNCYFNLPKFDNFLELIVEEMLLWLLVAEPYPAGALERHLPKAPFVRVVQTGMSAFSEIVQLLVKPETTILAFDDCYYECLFHLEGVQGEIIRGPDYGASLEEGLRKVKKVDLLFIDFHQNVTPGKRHSERHDIKTLFSQVLPYASDSITLVIDNTIGYLDSAEVADLLHAFPNRNIIVFSSHQKFDLFGTDKVSGGSYFVYSQDEKLLDGFRAIQGGEIDLLSRQLLTHFFTFGRPHLKERQRRIFSNGWYANEQVNPEIPGLIRKSDPCSFSLDIHCKGAHLKEGEILSHFHARGIPLTSRLSFGFNTLSQTVVKEDLIRYSMGVEERAFIDLFLDVFSSYFSTIK